MESRIPLPTDNIFKFCALFSMLVFFSSFAGMLYKTDKTNDLIFSTHIALADISEDATPSASVKAQKEVLERRLEIAISDKDFFRWLFSGLAAASFWLGFYGFTRWHRHVQPRLDEAQSIQIELAKLSLEKLKFEVEKLRRDSVD
ncbi:hypothetical protein [Pseudomonas sp. EL_65y_Pfl2_R95]|uniref:hypothetical protein n=1 Tax=Pseudomonas sp. EL_65y_Pfl2_R95 TaxID=3088698 RepID=UPI0030DD7178